ncbi:phospholipase D family protein [Jhaorihella thermophila]
MLRFLIGVVVVLAATSFVFQNVYSVPSRAGLAHDRAIPADPGTRLGAWVLPLEAANPGRSGVASLGDGAAAFAARLLLIEAAEASIDIRYYIWQRDVTGLLLLDALRRAADRGVRVRILLDDNGIPGLDPILAQLDAHPNIQVRLFNPFALRTPRMLSYVLDFRRLNRRMHNKSMTVDGVVSIIGGRNIGDIYFSSDPNVNYFDMDVAVLGPASRDVSEDFDLYWASPPVFAAAAILSPAESGADRLGAALAALRTDDRAQRYARAVSDLDLLDRIRHGAVGFDWVPVQLVSDDPVKGQGPAPAAALLTTRLAEILPRPEREVLLASAYFVPGERFSARLADWARKGVAVDILTNSLESTDVLPVHAGYMKYGDRLLAADVGLHELRSTQARRDLAEKFDLIGSTNSSLHAKSFVIDERTVFVGSFNFDPRSANLNTEMGFLIDSQKLARNMAARFKAALPTRSYRVELVDDRLEWVERREDGTVIRHEIEPGTGLVERFVAGVIRWLPVEWLL